MRLSVFLVMSVLAASGCAGGDNQRLTEIVRADQAEREREWRPEDFAEIYKRDASRRDQVHEELVAGRVRSAVDFYSAALVMQHGSTLEEIRMAAQVIGDHVLGKRLGRCSSALLLAHMSI